MIGWREVLDGAVRVAVVEGDCLDVLRAMPEASVDAIMTLDADGAWCHNRVHAEASAS